MTRRQRTTYSEEYKLQMVELNNYGKSASEITSDYDLTPSSIHNWVRQFKKNGTVQKESKLTVEQKEIIAKDKRIRHMNCKMKLTTR